MNVWKLTGANRLTRMDAPVPPAEAGKVRVRITKVFLGEADAAIYGGSLRFHYPIIPGRFAVGALLDEELSPEKKHSTRVLLHAYCREPYAGTAKVDFSGDEIIARGQTRDGFLQDIVSVSPEDLTIIPERPVGKDVDSEPILTDEQLLAAHYVGLAKSAIDKLSIQRGQHIAVLGADLFGIIVCQLLIARQAAPILIDADKEKLEFARTCGIYYTLPDDDSLIDGVANLTGGRLAAGSVVILGAAGVDCNTAFRVSARNATSVACGPLPVGAVCNMELALRKQICLRFLWLNEVNLQAAFNLFLTHAVNIESFSTHTVKADEAGSLLEELFRHPELASRTINVVKLY